MKKIHSHLKAPQPPRAMLKTKATSAPRPIAKPESKNIPDIPGTAKVCIDDTEFQFGKFEDLTLSATQFLEIQGVFVWRQERPAGIGAMENLKAARQS